MLLSAMVLAGLAAGSSQGQTLKRRGAIVTPQLETTYASPEYTAAYQTAEITFDAARPRTFKPYLWDAKRPLAWIGNKQAEFGRYTIEFGDFEEQLDAASESVVVRKDPQKVAQLSQIQDRLTEENLNALNAMITAVNLGQHFVSNNRPEIANLWVVWSLPESRQRLDESKMKDVLKFTSNVIKCFYESKNYPAQYSHSASFNTNIPTGADNKAVTNEEALAYWHWNNHAPVDTAIVSLYNSLHQAEETAAKEGLLETGSQTLRAKK